MSKYIDIEWLKKKKRFDSKQQRHIVRMTDIYTAPSIDIVRCKECKYWKESQYYHEVMACTYVKGATFTRQHDDFCSRGEREGE